MVEQHDEVKSGLEDEVAVTWCDDVMLSHDIILYKLQLASSVRMEAASLPLSELTHCSLR